MTLVWPFAFSVAVWHCTCGVPFTTWEDVEPILYEGRLGGFRHADCSDTVRSASVDANPSH